MSDDGQLPTLGEIMSDDEIKAYIKCGDTQLGNIGLTEHGLRHARLVSNIAGNVMRRLRYSDRHVRLASVAGYIHDIGNVFNRHDHATSGAILAQRMLDKRNFEAKDVAIISGAIGNHEERNGKIVSPVAAALVLADKSDVHRSRVRLEDPAEFDIHDRVNYAAERSFLDVKKKEQSISLRMQIDTNISPVMDYFEIFMTRMIMCRRAATFLGQRFEVHVNGMRML